MHTNGTFLSQFLYEPELKAVQIYLARIFCIFSSSLSYSPEAFQVSNRKRMMTPSALPGVTTDFTSFEKGRKSKKGL